MMGSKKFVLPVEIETLEEGGYLAICPVLQGCHAEGDTIPEALENLEDAARLMFEFLKEKKLPLPPELKLQQKQVVLREEILVSVDA